MAGIGFELKKLFVGRGALSKLRAYAYAGIICSGTMLLAVGLLIGLQALAKASGMMEHDREILVVMIVYATLFSLLLSAVLQTLLSRFVADMLYQEKYERILPSLLGGSLMLMVPGGIAFGILLSFASEISVLDRALDWILCMELIPIWLQMAYITAVKDYRRILLVFAGGVVIAFMLGAGLISLGLSARTSLLIAMVSGYGTMLFGFTEALQRYFPTGTGSVFAFVEWFDHAPGLGAIGFLGMAGAFVHLVTMWFSPLGETTTGPFRQAGTFDAAAFAAFLVTVPANINFVVSVEVNFYQKYRNYFGTVNGGGTLSQIILARNDMNTVMRHEIFKLAQVQVFCMVAYIIFARYLLEALGFTTDMIEMFQVMSIGYSAYAIANSVMLLQLYFDDRKGALASCLALFIVNLGVSLWTRTGPPLYYGLGIVAGGVAMYLTAMPRLYRYVKQIDYYVFCGQPVLASIRSGLWTRLAAKLDARAAVRAEEIHKGRRETK